MTIQLDGRIAGQVSVTANGASTIYKDTPTISAHQAALNYVATLATPNKPVAARLVTTTNPAGVPVLIDHTATITKTKTTQIPAAQNGGQTLPTHTVTLPPVPAPTVPPAPPSSQVETGHRWVKPLVSLAVLVALVAGSVWSIRHYLAAPATATTKPASSGGPIIATADSFICYTGPDGKGVTCRGSNETGTLGDGKVAKTGGGPIEALKDETVIAMAASNYTVCATTIKTGLWCWGSGWLGHDVKPPTRIEGIPANTRLPLLALGATHACASDGKTIWCLGDNQYGQTVSAGPNPFTAVQVPGLPQATVTRLDADAYANIAVIGGQMWGWGNNSYTELGAGQPVKKPARLD